jgi:hypothetical protein
MRTGCVTSADGSLTMIMLSASLKGCARWHLSARHPGVLIGRPLGYEANGARPTHPVGSHHIAPSQGRPSIVSHLVQPAQPLPATSLLPFLLRGGDL